MQIAIISINKDGEVLADKLKQHLEDAAIVRLAKRDDGEKGMINSQVGGLFAQYDGLIFIAALGIVVRLISPFIDDKLSDPAVVAVDTAGRHSISLLSGHEGGANNLSYLVAAILDSIPVVTTGTEVHKSIIIGTGCRRGIEMDKVRKAIIDALEEQNIGIDEVRLVATIDLKKDEKGLTEACESLGLPLVFISKDTIKNYKGDISSSEIVKKNIGVDGVCEPCAILAGRRAKLIVRKKIVKGVTIAIARED